MQIRHRLEGKEFLDDRVDDGRPRRQRVRDFILRVAERRLGFDGHRGVVDVPALLSFLPSFWAMLFAAGAGGDLNLTWVLDSDSDSGSASVLGSQMGSPEMQIQE